MHAIEGIRIRVIDFSWAAQAKKRYQSQPLRFLHDGACDDSLESRLQSRVVFRFEQGVDLIERFLHRIVTVLAEIFQRTSDNFDIF